MRLLARGIVCTSLGLASCLVGACRSRAHESAVVPIPSSEIVDATRPTTPRGLLQRFPLRLHTRWTDRVEQSGRTTFEAIEERWLPVDATSWDVVSWASSDAGSNDLATRFTLRAEGLYAVGVRFQDAYDPYDAPRLWLPSDAHVGQTWSEVHATPVEPRECRCRVDPNPACSGGLAVVCARTYSTGERTTRTHLFCEDVGWTGYSFTALDKDGKTTVERRWGEDVHAVPQ